MANGDTPDFIPASTPDFIPAPPTIKKKATSLYERATTPLVSPETVRKGTVYESEKAKSEKAIKEGGQPFKAGAYAFGAGVDKSFSDLVSSFSSPASLGLMAASGGESALGSGVLKTLLRALGLGGAGLFGAQGAKQAVKTNPMDYLRAIGYNTGISKTPPKASAEQQEQSLFGASAAVGAAAGAGAMSRDALHSVLRRSLKLDEDLAGKVADKVTKAQQARAQQAGGRQLRKNIAQTLDEQKMEAGGHLLADTTQALVQEQARVSKPFHDIAMKIKDPVTDATSVRTLVEDAFKQTGANPSEIPSAALKALGPDSGPPSIVFMGQKTPIASLTPAVRKSLGVVPTDNVSFGDLTRIREDLGGAAQAAKDTTVKRALFDAQDKITAIQEKAAEAKGLGKEYKTAKVDYMKFKRGIGSDLINNWLSSYDVEDQAIAPKVAKLFNKSSSEALRNILKASGIDTGPLDQIAENIRGTKGVFKEMAGEEKKAIKKAESTKDIIPGTTTADLSGMSNEDLQRTRLQAQANSMKEAGIRQPFALMQYAIGLFQLLRGSAFGTYHLARAGAMTIIPEKIKSPAFQDWIMDKAGIEDRVLTKKITDGLYNAVRTSMKSGVQEQATAKKAEMATAAQ